MSFFSKFSSTRFPRVLSTLAKSAAVGLVITILIFFYEVWSGKKQFGETVDRLDNISKSLSTRCLGKFPAYILEINNVFASLQPGDTIVIFEDVLYYGIISNPSGFCQLQQHLLNHARQGGKVIVAYYDNHCLKAVLPWTTVFHRMIVEDRIDSKYRPLISADRHRRFEELAAQRVAADTTKTQKRTSRMSSMVAIDSCITEQYYALTTDNDISGAQQVVSRHLAFYDFIRDNEQTFDYVVRSLSHDIDTIIRHYIEIGGQSGKQSVKDIHFADYVNMYSDITDRIAKCYQDNGIELYPVNEYFTMSCWLVKPADPMRSVASILAFPSKYSSDEIGFYSQDDMFADYIMTILEGIRGNLNTDRDRKSSF